MLIEAKHHRILKTHLEETQLTGHICKYYIYLKRSHNHRPFLSDHLLFYILHLLDVPTIPCSQDLCIYSEYFHPRNVYAP